MRRRNSTALAVHTSSDIPRGRRRSRADGGTTNSWPVICIRPSESRLATCTRTGADETSSRRTHSRSSVSGCRTGLNTIPRLNPVLFSTCPVPFAHYLTNRFHLVRRLMRENVLEGVRDSIPFRGVFNPGLRNPAPTARPAGLSVESARSRRAGRHRGAPRYGRPGGLCGRRTASRLHRC